MRQRALLVLTISIIAAIALFIPLHRLHASPGVYYVDAVNGNDATGDGSQARPWRTITYALSRVSSGDTIRVLTGTYNIALGEAFPLNLPPGVSLIGSGRDATVISGQSTSAVLYIGSETTHILSNTMVSNLTLQGGSVGLDIYATAGVTVAPSIAGLRVRGNKIGIRMQTSDVYQYGATIAPVISGTEAVSNTQDGIYIRSYGYFSASRVAPVIQGSIVRGNGRYGIYVEATAVGANGTSATPRILATRIAQNGEHGIFSTGTYQGWAQPQIERSWITDNKGYGFYWVNGINGGNLNGGITNTVISRNGGGGIYLDAPSNWTTGSFRIVNDTITDNARYGIYWVRSTRLSPLVVNTILWNPDADDLYSTGDPWTTGEVKYCDIEDGDFNGAFGNFSADPLFVDDTHIGACSPAMNAGAAMYAPAVDIDGDPRPLGSAPDVGADEYEAPCLLRVSKSASQAQARLGDVLTYTIRLTNTTPTTSLNVLVTDVLPLPLEFGAAWASQGAPVYASGVLTWSGAIGPGATVNIGLQARVVRGSNLVNEVLADTGTLGLYRAVCRTLVEPARVFLPFTARNYCTGPIIDDFSDPASGWPVGSTSYWSFGYVNGEYRMYAKQDNVFGAVTRGDGPKGSLIFEVDVRRASAETGSMGIMYGLTPDWSQFYTFEIYPDTREYAVFRFSDGRWYLLAHGTSYAIRTGQSTNRLRMVMIPPTVLNLYVNGVHVASPEAYNPYEGYRVGLVAGADAAGFDARFDNYKLVPEGCPENPPAALRSAFPPLFEGQRDTGWRKGGLPEE